MIKLACLEFFINNFVGYAIHVTYKLMNIQVISRKMENFMPYLASVICNINESIAL